MTERTHVIIRVVDSSNKLVTGAFVWAETTTAPFPEIALVSDDNGEVRVSLPPGEFCFAARKDQLLGRGQIKVDKSEDERVLMVVLSDEPS